MVRTAVLDGRGKFRLHHDSIPGPASPQRVAVPTELPGPNIVGITVMSGGLQTANRHVLHFT
jgi:hypothetical protein